MTTLSVTSLGDPTRSAETLDLLRNDENAKAFKYSDKIAALLSAVAGWSYSDKDDFVQMLSQSEFINLSESDVVDFTVTCDPMFIVARAQILRTSDGKSAIVSFRGTEPLNLTNWGTDLDSGMDYYLDSEKKLLVHQGFLRNFRSVWDGKDGIWAHLKDPSKCGGDKGELEAIYITGHSLGGAMAFLAGLYISFFASREKDEKGIWNKLRGIYTYGQPMVIHEKSCKCCEDLFADRLFRHVYFNDVVPHVPTRGMGAYAHVGHEYRFRPWSWHGWKKIGWGKVTQLPLALPVLPFCLVDALGNVTFPFTFFKSPWSIVDHSPTNYMNSLNGIDRGSVLGILPQFQAFFGGDEGFKIMDKFTSDLVIESKGNVEDDPASKLNGTADGRSAKKLDVMIDSIGTKGISLMGGTISDSLQIVMD